MTKYIRTVLFAFNLLFFGVFRPTASNAADMDITLQKIMEAPRNVNYEGVLTIQKYTDEAEPLRNTHRIINRTGTELTGSTHPLKTGSWWFR